MAAEGHLLSAREPGDVRSKWKPWRFEALPIVLNAIPVQAGEIRSGQSHEPKIEAIRQALRGADRVVIATDPGREGSMIAWEVLEHLGWTGHVDRLKLGALDDLSIRRAFAAMAKEPDSGERDYAAYLETQCRHYEDYHLGLNGTRAISLRLRPAAFREPWRFGGVQTPTLAILADLEERIRAFVPRDFFKVGLPVAARGGAKLTLWNAPKGRIFEREIAEAIRDAAACWSGRLAVEQKDVRRPPPKLFTKDTPARRCAKRFGCPDASQDAAAASAEMTSTRSRTPGYRRPASNSPRQSTAARSCHVLLVRVGRLFFDPLLKLTAVVDPSESFCKGCEPLRSGHSATCLQRKRRVRRLSERAQLLASSIRRSTYRTPSSAHAPRRRPVSAPPRWQPDDVHGAAANADPLHPGVGGMGNAPGRSPESTSRRSKAPGLGRRSGAPLPHPAQNRPRRSSPHAPERSPSTLSVDHGRNFSPLNVSTMPVKTVGSPRLCAASWAPETAAKIARA